MFKLFDFFKKTPAPVVSRDEFGDRMKAYENAPMPVRFDVHLPIYARIDGRSFSKFTKGMKRPFDPKMSAAMIETAKVLVERTHARVGYTQSDEISLLFLAEDNAEIMFNGRSQKLISVLASIATVAFNRAISDTPGFSDYAKKMPHFDCRVCQLPSKTEAANMILWREMDAAKNAVSMAAQAHFSHSTLQGKSQADMLSMLASKGVNFDDYPSYFKQGTFLRRTTDVLSLTPEELEAIPASHRPHPNITYMRSVVKGIDMPRFGTVTNRPSVLFDNDEPSTL